MAYKIAKADIEADKERIISFWKLNRNELTRDKYLWMYEGNPYGKAHVWFIVNEDDDEIVGMSTLFPKNIHVGGSVYKTGIAGDFIVNNKHRSLGPALKLQKKILQEYEACGFHFIYGFPNKPAGAVLKFAGYKCLGKTVRMVRIIRTRNLLIKKGVPSVLSILIGPVLDIMLKMVSKDCWSWCDRGVDAVRINRFDDQFDQLWIADEGKNKIAADRSSQYLNWKYHEDPDDSHQTIAIIGRNDQLLKGYAVLCFRDDKMYIRDFSFPNHDGDCKVLLRELTKTASRMRARSMEFKFLENASIQGRLKEYNFLSRKSERRVYMHSSMDTLDDVSIVEPSNWFLVDSDQDT